jgi:TolA-binding protein
MRVDEIEIMGPPPGGVDLSPVMPALDTDLMKQASEQPAAGKNRNMAFIRTLAEIQVDGMRAMRTAIDQATDSARKAQAWLRLNAAADRLAEILDNQVDLKSLAEKAAALGVSLDLCEMSRVWDAGTQGYEKYLQLFPGGPQADEAWWKGRLSNGPRCGDFEGSPEEYRDLIEAYSEFVKRFPNSEFVPRARQRLDEYRKGLAGRRGTKPAK